MKITVDLDACQAHGDCVMAAPEIFDLGENDDVVSVLLTEPGEELRAKAERAARDCPVSAIQIVG